jgi:hypothetical protein
MLVFKAVHNGKVLCDHKIPAALPKLLSLASQFEAGNEDLDLVKNSELSQSSLCQQSPSLSRVGKDHLLSQFVHDRVKAKFFPNPGHKPPYFRLARNKKPELKFTKMASNHSRRIGRSKHQLMDD